MIFIINLTKLPNETEREFLWRVCSAKENGVINLTWDELADIINAEYREDESEYKSSSAYRKSYQYAKMFYDDVFSKITNDKTVALLEEQTQELVKIKKKVSDQRREFNKDLAKLARAEHLNDVVAESMKKVVESGEMVVVGDYSPILPETDTEAIICFADWHFGMVTDNIWNKYNTKICKTRLSTFVEKAITHLKLHKPKKLHILVLGDLCHGAIHTSARVASEEKTCDQIVMVSELLAQAVDKLSNFSFIEETKIYSTYGNHMRTVQNKKDSVHSDNMEKLISWWLESRFKDVDKVEIMDSEFKEFIKLKVADYNICCTHGDLDNFKNIGVTLNTIFSKIYNETIDYTISADKHHLEEFESFNIENILVRSLCGTDDFANDRRLYSEPGQSLMFFTKEDGRQCTYNIKV